jgi:hypothetical protein
LEKNGVVDALTKGLLLWTPVYIHIYTYLALVGLYEEPEKPDSPLDYLKHFISGTNDVDIAALKTENEELKKRVSVLELKLEESAANFKKLQDQQGVADDAVSWPCSKFRVSDCAFLVSC